jgi:putative tryptophan/tyrosine transport system substrate-binding protein
VSAVGRFDQLPTLAAELVGRWPDVLVAGPSPAVRALTQATTTIPIVMLSTPDPVREGFVTNLARPEANITGIGEFGLDLVAKRIELLKDMLPRLARLAIVWSVVTRSGPDPAYANPLYDDVTTTAAALGFSWNAFKAIVPEDYDGIFAQAAAQEFDAAYMVPSPRAFANQAIIAEAALRYRMPTVGDYGVFAKSGFLVTYGVNIEGNIVRGAEYVDKLLRGAKPADLPVEQPTKFELVINLKTAKALSLSVPPSLLARADEVIE